MVTTERCLGELEDRTLRLVTVSVLKPHWQNLRELDRHGPDLDVRDWFDINFHIQALGRGDSKFP